MSLLGVVVPDGPFGRAEVVAGRLAQNVAPLFGVPWRDQEFNRTWVCEYSALTLAEIARGAPLPLRNERRRDKQAGRKWHFIGAAVEAGQTDDGKDALLPNEIVNATVNRFGPDTKAAVVLTAANQLFEPVTEAILDAMAVIDRAAPPIRLRVAAWTGMILEAFRSQPALFAAAVRARAIQRAVTAQWTLPEPRSHSLSPLARCEGGVTEGAPTSGEALRPVDFSVIDATIVGLDLGVRSEAANQVLREDIAARLIGELLELGAGSVRALGHLWIAEHAPGVRTVEAYVPTQRVVDTFLQDLDRAVPDIGDLADALPDRPSLDVVVAVPPLAIRAMVLGYAAMLGHVRGHLRATWPVRLSVSGAFTEVAELAQNTLGNTDPLTELISAQALDLQLADLRHDERADRVTVLDLLHAAVNRSLRAYREGRLDRGAVAALLSSVNAELNNVREVGTAQADELSDLLRERWALYFDVLDLGEVLTGGGTASLGRGIRFHLHNYAAFLTSNVKSVPDQHLAYRLYAGAVIPAREEFYEATGGFAPLRLSLQLGALTARRLAERAVSRGERAAARQFASSARDWIDRIQTHPDVAVLTTDSTEAGFYYCYVAGTVLLVAAELGTPEPSEEDLAEIGGLLDLAEAFMVDGRRAHPWQRDLENYRKRLAALSTS